MDWESLVLKLRNGCKDREACVWILICKDWCFIEDLLRLITGFPGCHKARSAEKKGQNFYNTIIID